ncbi:hypothetical protein [Streptococcus massiliensis]|uniref:hypothetical protein n=1 Tax=Streptococcus massiliensis TaxID=313439 RepID=UPI00034B6ED3|nr:hypothetical protein [Streptococcus massiliensis]
MEKRSGLAAAVSFSELIGSIKKHLSEYQMVLLPSEEKMLLEFSDLKGQLNSASQLGFMF